MLFAQFLIEIKEQTLCPIDAMDLYMAIEFRFFLAIPRTFLCAYLYRRTPHTTENVSPSLKKQQQQKTRPI